MPWEAMPQMTLPEEVYYDPTRELAANSEQANIAGSVVGTFSGPQATSARISDIQGNALRNAADILGRYNNMNVQVANEFEMNQTQMLNQNSQMRSDRATRLYDKGVIANQQYDNAKAAGRQKMRDAFNQAWTNRGKTQALNSVNKQYKVDPITGFVEHTGVPGELNGNQQRADFDKIFEETSRNPLYKGDPKLILAAVKLKMGMKDQKSDVMPYDDYQQ
jgi:hypothetical protein